MTTLYKSLIWLNLIVLLVVSSVILFQPGDSKLGGTTNFNDLSVDSITNAGAFTQTGAIALNGEVSFGSNNCTAVTWNPGAVGSTTLDAVDITMPSGYAVGDHLFVGISTGTQGLAIAVNPSSTGANVILFDPDNTGAAINLATSTVGVCYADVTP